jgi:hypothetical protein
VCIYLIGNHASQNLANLKTNVSEYAFQFIFDLIAHKVVSLMLANAPPE